MRIYVGNLSPTVSSEDLRVAFSAYGKVKKATVVTDELSRHPTRFGLVEMPSISAAQAAVAGLNGKCLGGRNISVSRARGPLEH